MLLVDGEPGAIMEDIVHPDVALPADARLQATLERGDMVLDVLLEQGMPVAFASTRVMPFLLTPRSRHGRALGVQRTTAVLELEEVVHVGSGEAVQRSRDTRRTSPSSTASTCSPPRPAGTSTGSRTSIS